MVPQHPTPGNTALPQSSTVQHGEARATASVEVAAAVEKLLQLDVGDWPRSGLERIKLRTVRRVFRGELDGVPVHVKVFRADTIAARARDAVRRARGEREAQNLLRARELALPAVEPLAHGMALEAGQPCSFVVTRTTASRPFAFPAAPAVAERVGELVRRVHDAGVQPGDLHPGNVLVTDDGDALLCDLTSMQHGGAPTLRDRASALAFFCNPLDGGALDDDAAAFLRGYERAGAPLPAKLRELLATAAHRWRSKALRSFGRRSMRPCRHTETEPRRRATPRWFWFVGEHGVDEGDGLRDALRAFDGTGREPRRSGRRGAVWLEDGFVAKRRDAGKARRLWRAHYLLQFAAVPSPTPLALCLHDGVGHVFTRRIDNDDLQTELTEGRVDTRALAAAASALGDAVGRLHGHGLRNRDLKFENLVRDPVTGAVAMVDLDGVKLHAADDTRGCGRDLGRLLAAFRHAGSPGDGHTLRRFVAAYARARRLLLQRPPLTRILRRATERAGEWLARHAD